MSHVFLLGYRNANLGKGRAFCSREKSNDQTVKLVVSSPSGTPQLEEVFDHDSEQGTIYDQCPWPAYYSPSADRPNP